MASFRNLSLANLRKARESITFKKRFQDPQESPSSLSHRIVETPLLGPFSYIPYELGSLICEFIEDLATLKALCLVSRDYNEFASRRLYRSVRFSWPKGGKQSSSVYRIWVSRLAYDLMDH